MDNKEIIEALELGINTTRSMKALRKMQSVRDSLVGELGNESKATENVWVVFTLTAMRGGGQCLEHDGSFADKQSALEEMLNLDSRGYTAFMQEMERCKE